MVFIHAIAGSNPAATTNNKKKPFMACFYLPLGARLSDVNTMKVGSFRSVAT